MSVKKCLNCINSEKNPSIKINEKGLCKVCDSYKNQFSQRNLEKEIDFVKSLICNKNDHDAMVGISGGKDSAATLYSVKEWGFRPLAFTFDIGYTDKDMFAKSEKVAKSIDVDFELIDIKKYINKNDRESFKLMAEIYGEKISDQLKDKFKDLYEKGRKTYSTKDDIAFPYIRPCQICRKVVIKAYYEEAVKRGISVIFIGINEWTGLSNNTFSAVRKLQPFENRPPVYIVHYPFLIQRTSEDIKPILRKIGWKQKEGTSFIETGASACRLARACEHKAKELLRFHLDSTRLSREITAGFITKEQAQHAVENYQRADETVKNVLIDAGIIN